MARQFRLYYLLLALVITSAPSLVARADDARGIPRALPAGKLPNDERLGVLRDLNSYFPFSPPKSQAEWDKRVEPIRRRILVSQGLWPLQPRREPKAVVHGRVDRGEYTIDRVYLESYPGHFVTGSLYRPKDGSVKHPVIMCPYGHWANGRFHDDGKKSARNQIAEGAERFESGGRHPLQAMCVQLARMGCVVFQYDMVGRADSQQIAGSIAHSPDGCSRESNADGWGFCTPQAELRLQSIMGLHTYNSLCALDWLCTLPDVDTTRIGMTGGSGGGTQTFILCAIDPRPTVAVPAVMVSTAMQGGCVCENAPYLRIGTGNVEFAALFAPKPLCLIGANDWTIEIAAKGFPELQQIYKLLGKDRNVMAKVFPHFYHNYNFVSREVMYQWMNKHLKLGLASPVIEEDFQPLSIAEMTVWNDQHARPPSGDDYERSLTKLLAESDQQWLTSIEPKDAKSLADFRQVIHGALDIMLGSANPQRTIATHATHEQPVDTYAETVGLLREDARGAELPFIRLRPTRWNQHAVLWVDAAGKVGLYGSDGQPKQEVRRLLDSGYEVLAADLLYQGEFNKNGEAPTRMRRVKDDHHFCAYTLGYNPPLIAQRVQDILSLAALARSDKSTEQVHLVGLGEAGPWAAAAMALSSDQFDRAAIDTIGFRFAALQEIDDVNFLPGAVKYGDLPNMLALAVPHRLWLAGEGTEIPRIIQAAYQASEATGHIELYKGEDDRKSAAAAEWLIR